MGIVAYFREKQYIRRGLCVLKPTSARPLKHLSLHVGRDESSGLGLGIHFFNLKKNSSPVYNSARKQVDLR
jgi:hypothetical protein